MTHEGGLEALEKRVDGLARQLAWHRRAWVVVIAAAAAVGIVGAGGPKTEREIRATRFVVADAAGAFRGSLAVEPDGSAALRLGDAHGVERVTASGAESGGSVSVHEKDGKIAAKLVVEGSVPRLALSDRTGNDRLWVALRLGSPAIQFLGADGVARSGLATMNDDSGLAIISGITSGTPGLVLYDKSRKIVWSAP
jgi:hypothetical protein